MVLGWMSVDPDILNQNVSIMGALWEYLWVFGNTWFGMGIHLGTSQTIYGYTGIMFGNVWQYIWGYMGTDEFTNGNINEDI